MNNSSIYKLQSEFSTNKFKTSYSPEQRAALTLNQHLASDGQIAARVKSAASALKKILKKSKTSQVKIPELNQEEAQKQDIMEFLNHNNIIKQQTIDLLTGQSQFLNLRENQPNVAERPALKSKDFVEYNPEGSEITFLQPQNSFYISENGRKVYIDQDRNPKLVSTKNVYDSLSNEEMDELDQETQNNFLIYPDSRFKLVWDSIIMVAILYIMVFLPLELAFSEPNFTTINVLVDFLFIIDLFLNFFIPYLDKYDNLVCSYRQIAIKYLRSSFLFDLLGSVPFSLILEFSDLGSNNLKVTKFTRISRLYKLSRFLKLFFLMKIISKSRSKDKENMFSKFKKDNTSKKERLTLFLALFWLLVHLLSCLFILTGELSDLSWLDKAHSDNVSLYFDAVYFSLTTIFSVGYGDILPISLSERLFVILLMFFGVLTYSFAISVVSSLIMTKDVFTAAYIERLSVLQRIREEFKLSHTETEKIEHYLNYSTKINKKEKYNFVFDLPSFLREKVIFVIFRENINYNRFLFNKENEFIFRFLEYIKPFRLFRKEFLTFKGEYLKEMYFVEKGRLAVTLCSRFDNLKLIELHRFESYGDVLIVTGKRNPLNLTCKTRVCEIYVLTKESFDFLLEEFPKEIQNNLLVNAYNFASLMDVVEIKVRKISAVGESFIGMGTEENLIEEAKNAVGEYFGSDVKEVKVNLHKMHKDLREINEVATIGGETKRLLEDLVGNDFTGLTTVRKVKKSSQVIKKVAGYNVKRREQPEVFVRRRLFKTQERKKMKTLKRMLSKLREL